MLYDQPRVILYNCITSMKHVYIQSAALSLPIEWVKDPSVLFTTTILLKLLDVFVKFVEMLALSVELLLKLLQTLHFFLPNEQVL